MPRIFYQVTVCNEFLRQTEPSLLNERGVGADLQDKILGMRAEARFLRSLSYLHGLDFFQNIPFVTEADPVGAFFQCKKMRHLSTIMSNQKC